MVFIIRVYKNITLFLKIILSIKSIDFIAIITIWNYFTTIISKIRINHNILLRSLFAD